MLYGVTIALSLFCSDITILSYCSKMTTELYKQSVLLYFLASPEQEEEELSLPDGCNHRQHRNHRNHRNPCIIDTSLTLKGLCSLSFNFPWNKANIARPLPCHTRVTFVQEKIRAHSRTFAFPGLRCYKRKFKNF